MAEQLHFGVTPDELRRLSGHLEEVSSRMKAVMSTLAVDLAGEGAPWGQFSDDDSGVSAQLDQVYGSVDAKTGLLDYYVDFFKRTADSVEQSAGAA